MPDAHKMCTDATEIKKTVEKNLKAHSEPYSNDVVAKLHNSEEKRRLLKPQREMRKTTAP